MVKFNGVKSLKLTTIDAARVIAVGKTLGFDNTIVWKKGIEPSPAGSLTFDGKSTVTYVGQEALVGASGFNLTLYQVTGAANPQKVADELSANKMPPVSEAYKIVDGWAEGNIIAGQLLGFDPTATVKIYQQQEGTFVLVIHDRKDPTEKLVPTLSFKGMNQKKADAFISAVVNATTYDIEDIRVQDTQTWIVAKDPKSNDILNGAFFKFASVSQSQTGKPVVSINFDEKGKDIFCNITEANIGKQMAIFVGGQLMTSPVIQDKICGGSAQIDGTFDVK